MISKPPSPNSHKSRTRKYLISGGVIIVLLLCIAISWQNAVNLQVREAQKLPQAQQEKRLRALSIVTLHNDSVQRAQGAFYRSLNRYDLAAESYSKGSSKLSLEAAHDYIQSGRYDLAAKAVQKVGKSYPSQEVARYGAIIAFNKSDVVLGCKKAEEAMDVSLQQACGWLKTGEVRGGKAFRLAEWQIYEPAQKALKEDADSTAENFLLLAHIAQQQRKLEDAAGYLRDGLTMFPWRRDLAHAAKELCAQEGSGVKACSNLTNTADTVLKQTDFQL